MMSILDVGKEGDGSRISFSSRQIIEAVRQGDVNGVRAFLEAGVDVNISSPKTGRTLLHFACRQGCGEIVSLLLSRGANPGAKTMRDLSPLHLACNQGHFKVSRLLLEAWAAVDEQDQAGTTPLHLSSQKGYSDIVRLLLQCGADRNGLDKSGWTPLHYAAWRGHAEVARMLMQAGANAKAADPQEKCTPLHLACASGHPEAVKVLLEFGADPSATDSHGARPDDVIGMGGSGDLEPSCKRELSEIVVNHRTKIKGRNESPSSLECVVDFLRAKVSELEDQLGRARRDHLEVLAYLTDKDHSSFTAALKPECVICLIEAKEVVLDPCRHLATCYNCAVALPSCPFCGCPVVGFECLESRRVYLRISSLENECTVLKTQMERFSNRVRDLLTENGQLKLENRRTEADAAILRTEQTALDAPIAQRYRFSSLSSPKNASRLPRTLPRDDRIGDNACDSQEAVIDPRCFVRCNESNANDSGISKSITKTSAMSTRMNSVKHGEIELDSAVPGAINFPTTGNGGGFLSIEGNGPRSKGIWRAINNERYTSPAAFDTYSIPSHMLPMKVDVHHRSLKNTAANKATSRAAHSSGSQYVSNPKEKFIPCAHVIGGHGDQNNDISSGATRDSVHEQKTVDVQRSSQQDKPRTDIDAGIQRRSDGGGSAERNARHEEPVMDDDTSPNVTVFSTVSDILPRKVNLNATATEVTPRVARSGGSPFVTNPNRNSIPGANTIGNREDQKDDERSIAKNNRVHRRKTGGAERSSWPEKIRTDSDGGMRGRDDGDSLAERDTYKEESLMVDDTRPNAFTAYSTASLMLPIKVDVRRMGLKNATATKVTPRVNHNSGSPYVSKPKKKSIPGSNAINDEGQKSAVRSNAKSESSHERKTGCAERSFQKDKMTEGDFGMRGRGDGDSSAERYTHGEESVMVDNTSSTAFIAYSTVSNMLPMKVDVRRGDFKNGAAVKATPCVTRNSGSRFVETPKGNLIPGVKAISDREDNENDVRSTTSEKVERKTSGAKRSSRREEIHTDCNTGMRGRGDGDGSAERKTCDMLGYTVDTLDYMVQHQRFYRDNICDTESSLSEPTSAQSESNFLIVGGSDHSSIDDGKTADEGVRPNAIDVARVAEATKVPRSPCAMLLTPGILSGAEDEKIKDSSRIPSKGVTSEDNGNTADIEVAERGYSTPACKDSAAADCDNNDILSGNSLGDVSSSVLHHMEHGSVSRTRRVDEDVLYVNSDNTSKGGSRDISVSSLCPSPVALERLSSRRGSMSKRKIARLKTPNG